MYNKIKKADPELYGLNISLSGNPSFENLVANKILTNKVVQNAGLARPKCLVFVPQAFAKTVPSQLADRLNLFDDDDIYQLNGHAGRVKRTVNAVLCRFGVENIVVKPNLGMKGEGVEFFVNQTSPHKILGNRKSAIDAICHVLASGDGAIVEERIFSPDHGKSVIRAIGISSNLQLMTGLDVVLDQNYKPIFLEANGNRSAGLNWLLKFGQRESVQKVFNCIIRAAQTYKDDCEQKHPNSVECAGFFVKMWTEEVNKPVNTTLGAITQSWDQWAENNVPHNISRRVAQGIEQLVVESFSALQEVAILGV